MRRFAIACSLIVTTLGLVRVSAAHRHDEFVAPAAFALEHPALGGPRPAPAAPPYLTSTRIAFLESL